jgi:hypothetical protein
MEDLLDLLTYLDRSDRQLRYYEKPAWIKKNAARNKEMRMRHLAKPRKGYYWAEYKNPNNNATSRSGPMERDTYFYRQVKIGTKPPPYKFGRKKRANRTMKQMLEELERSERKRDAEKRKKKAEANKRKAAIAAAAAREKASIEKAEKARSSHGKYPRPAWWATAKRNAFGMPIDPNKPSRSSRRRPRGASRRRRRESSRPKRKAAPAPQPPSQPQFWPNGRPNPLYRPPKKSRSQRSRPKSRRPKARRPRYARSSRRRSSRRRSSRRRSSRRRSRR